MREQHVAARHIETGGRLVDDEKTGIVQECAGDLDAPPKSSRQGAYLVAGSLRNAKPLQFDGSPFSEPCAGKPMQSRVISEVVHNGQLEVEGRHLEDDAEIGERRQRIAADRMSKDDGYRPVAHCINQ